MTKTKVSAEEKLLNDICALMDSSDCPPWQKPWSGHAGNHRNLATGQEYRGCNPLLLEMGMMMRDSVTPIWIGGGQAKAKGWHPKKGSRAVRILMPVPHKSEVLGDDGKAKLDANGEPEFSAWITYRAAPIFNISDIQGSTDESQAELDRCIDAALAQVATAIDSKQRVHQAEAAIDEWRYEQARPVLDERC